MKIFTYYTPEQVPIQDQPDCAVVIDVLRATTTIATALKHGACGIRTFADFDSLNQAALGYAPGTCLKAGERGGKEVPGFDLGNSPFEYTPERIKDQWILISTTNGTRALSVAQKATVLITAAIVNLDAVRIFLKDRDFATVWIIGSGWEGAYSLEDTVCAGAVSLELGQAGNDETIAAQALYQQWQGDLLGLLKQASHGQRLLGLGLDRDLAYCSTPSSIGLVPLRHPDGYLSGHLI